jgi:hypothetical protein
MVQTYGGRDGSGRNIIEGPNQPAFADSRGNLLEGGGRRGGRRQAGLLSGRLHGTADLGEILRRPVINNPHSNHKKKRVVFKNQNYLKNKVKT